MNYKEMAVQLVMDRYDAIKTERETQLKNLRKDLQEHRKKLVFFGAGLLGRSEYVIFQNEGVEADLFCDNDKKLWGRVITDHKSCISPVELSTMKNIVVFITMGKAYEALEQLNAMSLESAEIYQYPLLSFEKMHNNQFDYSKEEICGKLGQMFELLEDEQSKEAAYWQVRGWFADSAELNSIFYRDIMTGDGYVPKDIFPDVEEETVVDCGTYDGDTYRYLKEKGMTWQKYIGFEMNRENYDRFMESVTDQDERASLQLYHAGVGDREETVTYYNGLSGSKIVDNGTESSQIVLVDHVLEESEMMSYLKMDIEGAEMPALRGAKDTIKRCRPKCAICAYHQPSDLWDIPIFLKELVPEYRIYFRHHDYIHTDIICYAAV